MKTRDEIKKGLECCRQVNCPGDICPYYCEEYCITNMSGDALALIRQSERERDAMLDSMKQDPHCCFHCNGIGCITRKARGDGSCFEWRGLEEDENERES